MGIITNDRNNYEQLRDLKFLDSVDVKWRILLMDYRKWTKLSPDKIKEPRHFSYS